MKKMIYYVSHINYNATVNFVHYVSFKLNHNHMFETVLFSFFLYSLLLIKPFFPEFTF